MLSNCTFWLNMFLAFSCLFGYAFVQTDTRTAFNEREIDVKN